MLEETKAKWTFMVYLAGDNNLCSAGVKDLGEMRTVGSTKKVNVVVQFDRSEADNATMRYHIQKDGLNETKHNLGETDSGDPEELLKFLKWVKEDYPAENYALILWNHGNGWIPTEMDKVARSVGPRDYTVRESEEHAATPVGRAFFRSTIKQIFEVPSASQRAILCDDGSGHSLDTLELGKVLKEAKAIFGKKLDILGMDACLMSNIEVAYQARDYVQYIVGSEENEPSDGWPYDKVLAYLVNKPETTSKDFIEHIVTAYVKSYKDRGYTGTVTQSGLDLACIDQVTEKLDALCDDLIPVMDEGRYWIYDAHYATKGKFYHSTLWDIADFCGTLADKAVNRPVSMPITPQAQAVSASASAVNAAIISEETRFMFAQKPEEPESRFVFVEDHHGAKAERCGGVTIYVPPRVLQSISPWYKDLAFAKDHKWLKLLEAYHN